MKNLSSKGIEPRYFNVDDTFAIFLREKGRSLPYFAGKITDITKYQYKTSSNIYSIRMTKSLYRKIKDKTIYIQIGKIKKPIYVNTPYIETLI